MYNARPMSKQLPLWPYIFFALLTGVIGLVLLIYNIGSAVPAEATLEKISGNVATLYLIDDLSGERTTMMKPMNSIHFTLKEVEGEFRYPNGWPGFNKMWQQLSFHVDLWVPGTDIGTGVPLVVYQLEQQVPENWVVEPYSVSYAEIADSQNSSGRSYLKVGGVLSAISGGFVLIAMLVRTRNRRLPRA
jgi:hypothetical protein